jgi:succinate dehydrogenase / fumarate reductase, cytochrome b subunit
MPGSPARTARSAVGAAQSPWSTTMSADLTQRKTPEGSNAHKGAPSGAPVGPPRDRSKYWVVDFYRSAVGKKYVMAITGIILMGYVLVHMIGNLKIYFGEEPLNEYAEFLRAFGSPILPYEYFLWGMRGLLLATVGLHIHASWSLTQMNRRARRTKYASKRDFIAADFAARSMRWTGIIVLLFIVFHIADLTLGVTGGEFEYGSVYQNIVNSFSRLPVAIFYVAANIALGVHLYHGAWSLFQSLGLNNRRFNAWRRYFAIGFAAVVVLGNISFPIGVQLGIIS